MRRLTVFTGVSGSGKSSLIHGSVAGQEGVAATCEDCDGKRFQAEVLKYTFGGKDISQVLAMTVDEAAGSCSRGRLRIWLRPAPR